MKVSQLRQLINEEVRSMLNFESMSPSKLTEVKAPTFQAKHKNNNLVAAIYFSWKKAGNNNASLWDNVKLIIEQNDCKLINYVVTDSVCEFEFRPKGPVYQDLLEEAKNNVEDALNPLSSQFTGYDVYIVGN